MSKKRNHIDRKNEQLNPIPWVAGALFVLGIAILAGIYRQQTAVVDEVRFSGYHYVELEALEQAVVIPEGTSPDSLNVLEITGSLEQIDYVEQARVRVQPGGDLLIEITERTPIAMLSDGGQKSYADEHGVRLPLILEKAADVPILYGFPAAPVGDTLTSEGWRQVRDFLVEMRRNPVGNATISEIMWTETDGVVALSHENSVRLLFGKEEFGSRMRNWQAFYSNVVREKGIQHMNSVDLRFRGQVVTRESG